MLLAIGVPVPQGNFSSLKVHWGKLFLVWLLFWPSLHLCTAAVKKTRMLDWWHCCRQHDRSNRGKNICVPEGLHNSTHEKRTEKKSSKAKKKKKKQQRKIFQKHPKMQEQLSNSENTAVHLFDNFDKPEKTGRNEMKDPCRKYWHAKKILLDFLNFFFFCPVFSRFQGHPQRKGQRSVGIGKTPKKKWEKPKLCSKQTFSFCRIKKGNEVKTVFENKCQYLWNFLSFFVFF